MAKAKAVARERTKAQIDSELRREKDGWGKLTIRHTEKSVKDLDKLRRRFDESDPEIVRIALSELAAKRGRNAL